ncbi:MAG TPA: PKD domain-containing protein, partial [Bacteroidales bacterium]|nr:PKD domain-containing protein [Bacteroidales bacterium]
MIGINKIFRTSVRNSIIAVLGLFYANIASAQLVIDNTMTPQQLVQNILVGSGVSAFNITYTGNVANAICAFSNGNTTNLGLDEGILLSTGIAAEASNPQSFQASTNNFEPGDPDLDNIPGVLGTNDASTLEFDFIPQSDTLTFRYVFGSEEYPEFVGSYNDVFAFFISGPNPAGGNYVNQNIALIPGTILPVSINNINIGSYPEYYIDNTGGLTICYDGFTVVMEAVAILAPCSTYHMKLTIADDLDESYDSGVFLKANSFSAQGLNISSNFSSSSPSYATVIEGCNDATIYFELVDTLTYDYPIYFEYLGTAVNGVDYNLLPDSIIIPAGFTQDSINIIPVQNNAIDPTRTIMIVFDYESACASEVDTLELTLLDNTIEMTGLDTLYCSSDPPVNLSVYPPSGVLTGPGTSGTTFNPGTGGFGMRVISFTNYFIDFTVNPFDTVCISQVTDTTWVSPQAVAIAGSNERICQGSPFDFNASLVIPNAINFDSLRWTGGIGTFSDPTILRPVYYPEPGELGNVILTLTAFGMEPCADASSSMILTLDTLPIASISALPLDTVCIGENVSFTGSANCAIETWQWDFGDGNTGSGPNVSHIYSNPGNYLISVIATSPNNCIDTAYLTKIISDPQIDFYTTPNPSCVDDTVWFHGTGDVASYTDWVWDFGDGNGDIGRDVWHVYKNPGMMTVNLVVCTKNVQHSHTVVPKATADAGSSEAICETQPFDFSTALTPASAADYQSLMWTTDGTGSFDDPTLLHPVYTPPPGEFGTFNFMLVAYSMAPCSNDTSYMTLGVFDGPEADYTITPGDSICVGEIISFDATSTTNIVNWQWNFGDGNTGNGQNITHAFVTPGIYDIRLIVVNDNSCRDTVQYSLEVFELPVAGFNVSPGNNICRFEELNFFGSSTTGILEWRWDLGDGTIANTQNVAHTYTAAGTYNVSLSVYNENSCRDTITQVVNIYELPVCDFTISPNDSSCVNEPVIFNGSGTADITSWSWDFDDGTTGNGQVVTHTYTTAGNYNVSLVVSNANGCLDTMIYQRVVVNPTIDFNMNLSPSCEGYIVDFTGIGNYAFTDYAWDFGDGATAIGKNASHIFGTPGTYTVTLSFCTSQVQHDILVNPLPTAFAGSDTISCEDVPFDLSTLNIPPLATDYSSIMWYGGAGTFDDPSLMAPVYTPADNELGFITLYMVSYGISPCYNDTSSMTIEVIEGAYAFAGGDGNACQDEPFDFANLVPPPAAYNEIFRMWSGGAGTFVDPMAEVPVYIPAAGETGPITFTFIASNVLNCDSVDQVVLNIHPIYYEAMSDTVCFGDSLLLPGGSWANSSGFYVDTLMSVWNCDSVIGTDLYVYPEIDTDFDITPNDSTCLDEEVVFVTIGTSNIISRLWNFGDGTTSTAVDPSHAYASPGTYTVTYSYTDNFGCSDVKSHEVHVFEHPDVDFTSSALSACINAQFVFNGFSSDDIIQWDWDFGDGTTGTGQNVNHIYNTFGQLSVTLTVTASNLCESSITKNIFVASPPTADFTYNIISCDTIQFT